MAKKARGWGAPTAQKISCEKRGAYWRCEVKATPSRKMKSTIKAVRVYGSGKTYGAAIKDALRAFRTGEAYRVEYKR